MKKLIITVLIAVTAICTVEAQEKIGTSNFKQEGISISNFKADNISDSELLITVDYSYTGDVESKDIFINAFPMMNDGIANFKGVSVERIPIEVGNHQANMKISKNPGGKNFRSESIKICVLAKRHSILCEEFPFAKLWVDIENPAKINSFLSSKNQVKIGDSVTLTWETENASLVLLGKAGTEDFHEVPSNGSENVVIDRTTSYQLMASPKSKGPAKVESKGVKISVIITPAIGSFYADRPRVRRGIKSKLLWKVFGADRVTLNGESVPEVGDKIVSPTRTTNYTLIAQTGDEIVKETFTVFVTPFGAPKLFPPFYSLELCKSIDVNAGRCISSDGPFAADDKIFVILRYKNLPKGKYLLKRITYRKFSIFGKWTKAHQEESSFQNSGKDDLLLTFSVVNLGEGLMKLKIILNGKEDTSSEIAYCVDCPRMWE